MTPEDLDRALVSGVEGPALGFSAAPALLLRHGAGALLQPAPLMLQRSPMRLEGLGSRRRIWARETHASFTFRGAGRPALQRPGASSALGGADSQKTGFSRVHTELQGSVHSWLRLWTKRWGGPASPGGARGSRAEQGGELGGGQESQGRVGRCPRPPGAGHAGPETAGRARPGQGSVPGIPGPCQLRRLPRGFPGSAPLTTRPLGSQARPSLTKLAHPQQGRRGAQLPDPAA